MFFRINFLVAKTGYPATDELMQRHDADITELLFFDAQGQLIERKLALLAITLYTTFILVIDMTELQLEGILELRFSIIQFQMSRHLYGRYKSLHIL